MIPFPDKKCQIIYADPPWKYEFANGYGRAEGWDAWGNEV